MHYSDSETLTLILCVPFGALIGYGVVLWVRHVKDRKLRALVATLMAEHKEARKHLVECPRCFYGKVWRPEVLAGEFPFDYDEPLLEDCRSCAGEGFVPRNQLA